MLMLTFKTTKYRKEYIRNHFESNNLENNLEWLFKQVLGINYIKRQ